jgi:sugar phosphate isomerase/epimerase
MLYYLQSFAQIAVSAVPLMIAVPAINISPKISLLMKRNIMELSITADYHTSEGCPEPYLQRIAQAGFTHVHWGYHYNTDFMYSQWEIEQIAVWLKEYGLKLLDLHASAGIEKRYDSLREYEHRSGVDLIKNRIEMAARLGSDVVILHVPQGPQAEPEKTQFETQVLKTLDALQPLAANHGVRIAVENLLVNNFSRIRDLFTRYDHDYLGLCYDSGHGNICDKQFDGLRSVKDRLISVHLHDNEGHSDQHRLLFSGTIDWQELAKIMAASSYKKCVSMELMTAYSEIESEEAFLAQAYKTGVEFTKMIDDYRNKG